jgi:hypothetical protein
MPLKKIPELLLKAPLPVVFLLSVYISLHSQEIRPAYGERRVTLLPIEKG